MVNGLPSWTAIFSLTCWTKLAQPDIWTLKGLGSFWRERKPGAPVDAGAYAA
jgi:hypothetical protein